MSDELLKLAEKVYDNEIGYDYALTEIVKTLRFSYSAAKKVLNGLLTEIELRDPKEKIMRNGNNHLQNLIDKIKSRGNRIPFEQLTENELLTFNDFQEYFEYDHDNGLVRVLPEPLPMDSAYRNGYDQWSDDGTDAYLNGKKAGESNQENYDWNFSGAEKRSIELARKAYHDKERQAQFARGWMMGKVHSKAGFPKFSNPTFDIKQALVSFVKENGVRARISVTRNGVVTITANRKKNAYKASPGETTEDFAAALMAVLVPNGVQSKANPFYVMENHISYFTFNKNTGRGSASYNTMIDGQAQLLPVSFYVPEQIQNIQVSGSRAVPVEVVDEIIKRVKNIRKHGLREGNFRSATENPRKPVHSIMTIDNADVFKMYCGVVMSGDEIDAMKRSYAEVVDAGATKMECRRITCVPCMEQQLEYIKRFGLSWHDYSNIEKIYGEKLGVKNGNKRNPATTITVDQLNLLKLFTESLRHQGVSYAGERYAGEMDAAGIPWRVQNLAAQFVDDNADRKFHLATYLDGRGIKTAGVNARNGRIKTAYYVLSYTPTGHKMEIQENDNGQWVFTTEKEATHFSDFLKSINSNDMLTYGVYSFDDSRQTRERIFKNYRATKNGVNNLPADVKFFQRLVYSRYQKLGIVDNEKLTGDYPLYISILTNKKGGYGSVTVYYNPEFGWVAVKTFDGPKGTTITEHFNTLYDFRAKKKNGVDAETAADRSNVDEFADTTDIDANSEMFQGEVSGNEFYADASEYTPQRLGRIGDLEHFIMADGTRYNFDNGAYVGADRRNNLWFVGHVQLDEDLPEPGQLQMLGQLAQMQYRTTKRHIESGNETSYYHDFGEVDGQLPFLAIDHEGTPLLVGGNYGVRREGVIN